MIGKEDSNCENTTAFQFVIVTGNSGSGKTTYCEKSKYPVLCYDKVYSYSQSSLLLSKIDVFFNKYEKSNIIYLDAYNTDLISYIKNKFPTSVFKCIFIYTYLDNYYNIMRITDSRNFITYDVSYDDYIMAMTKSILSIKAATNKLVRENIVSEIKYIYRNDKNNYENYEDETHLLKTINISKKEIVLNYINTVSGHSSYQSIILDGEYIKRGSEKDWISFDNILKCTSLKDKTICDTGCFNGYFSFRCIAEGTNKIIGIDHNENAINICKKLCIWNNYHLWKLGKKTDVSCKNGMDFHLKKIGKDDIFKFLEEDNVSIDVIFALNYLHHLKRELGLEVFKEVIDSFFKNSKEVIFEVNESEIEYIETISKNNNFVLTTKIESHRKTQFGNRSILHYTQ